MPPGLLSSKHASHNYPLIATQVKDPEYAKVPKSSKWQICWIRVERKTGSIIGLAMKKITNVSVMKCMPPQ